MSGIITKPIAVFFIGTIILTLVFFLFRIEMFDGQVVIEDQFGVEKLLEGKLSLSYFIGIGYTEEEISQVKDFYLTTQGYVMAVLILVGLPALLAYRVHLRQSQKEN